MEPKGHEGAHKHVELSKILGVLRICGTQQSPCTPPPPPRKSSAIAALVDWEFSQAKFSGEGIFD